MSNLGAANVTTFFIIFSLLSAIFANFAVLFTILNFIIEMEKNGVKTGAEPMVSDQVRKYDFDRVVRMVLTTIGVVLAIVVIDYLSPVLLPFVVGFILAYMLNPFVEWVQRVTHIHNRMAAVVVSLVLVQQLSYSE